MTLTTNQAQWVDYFWAFNKLVFKIIIFAIIYAQFMAVSMSLQTIYSQYANNGSLADTLLFAIPIFIIAALYSVTIIGFSPLLYLTTGLLFLFFSFVNTISGNKLKQGILFFGLQVKTKSKRNIFVKYSILYSLTFSSFIFFIYNGVYVPVWLYENLFHTRAFFRIDEAVYYFYNLKTATYSGFLGFLIFIVINELSRKIFSKRINFNNLIGVKD